MFDHWNFDRRNIVVTKLTLLGLSPSQAEFIDAQNMGEELKFLGPEKLVAVEVEIFETFLSESSAGREVGGMSR